MLKRGRDIPYIYDQNINYKYHKSNEYDNQLLENNKIKQLLELIWLKLEKLENEIKLIESNVTELSNSVIKERNNDQSGYYNSPCSYIS